ncbi:MAG: hypothetical protein IVW52_16720 [Acidimicrobiales bacterium]|nr:hypothetical protein [Acidimicrobiales bacterium]
MARSLGVALRFGGRKPQKRDRAQHKLPLVLGGGDLDLTTFGHPNHQRVLHKGAFLTG